MSQAIGKANTSAPSPERSSDRAPPKDRAQADYQRRLRAAGIKEDECPQDMDAFRFQLARMIAMFINSWRGCKEPLCRRHRGCMAPHNNCSNVKRPTPEELERNWPRVQATVYKALQAAIAARGGEDE